MYKNVKDMTTEELQTVAELVIALDKLQENESPEQVLELVTALQTVIRTPEAVVMEAAEAGDDLEDVEETTSDESETVEEAKEEKVEEPTEETEAPAEVEETSAE